MATRVVESSDSLQTEALGAELASSLNEGDVVLVTGELGAGKTTFVRGAARALGVTDPITSPTFSIGHRYRGTHVTVCHLDLYRLAGLQAEEPDLLDDYLGPGRIAFVEWPEQTAPEFRRARVQVALTHLDEQHRRVELRETPPQPDPDAGRPASGEYVPEVSAPQVSVPEVSVPEASVSEVSVSEISVSEVSR